MSEDKVAPAALPRRSFIYRILDGAGAEFAACGDAAVAMSYAGQSTAEIVIAKQLGLADLSPLPRIGYKGAGAPQWLRAQGLSLPDKPNVAVRQDNGMLVAALSWEEHLILGSFDIFSDIASNDIAVLNRAWTLEKAPRCYPLPRQDSHCWFALTGCHVSATLAKLCGVDMRLSKFADGSIAQTSLARINVVAIRNDLGATPTFYVLADNASADYLWSCLIDAANEFDGALVGLTALHALLAE